MTLKGNGLLKFLVPLILLVVIFVVVRGCSSDGGSDQQDAQHDPTRTLSNDEMQALGIEGDTPQDVVATLVGRMNVWERDRERDREAAQRLREENERLSRQANDVDGAVQNAIREERRRQQQEQQRAQASLINRFEQRLNRLLPQSEQSGEGEDDLPIGLGLEGGGGPSGTYDGSSDLQWVEPLDARVEQTRGGSGGGTGSGTTFPTSFREAAGEVGDVAMRAGNAAEARVTGRPDRSTERPVYTIPENSTLMGSLSMTAMLGRVPVDGTVNDPYPFKVIIGRDNLTANGIELPEVQAAVVSGTAQGDWTLSCVRGNITSMTFVFEDGTIRTVPTPDDVNQSRGNSNQNTAQNQRIGGGNSIGWISDQFGIPCISGVRRSNAQQYLGTQGLLTAAGAGVASLLSDDDNSSVTSISPDGTISQAMSGNQAMGQILTQGVNDMSQWVNRLYGEAFAAVYVPPGQNVAIHINKQLPIDFETEGRRVRYDAAATVSNELP